MTQQMKFKSGDVIYRQNENPDGVYFVQYGVVNLYTGYNTPDAHFVNDVREGRVLGILGLIEARRSATAIAKTDCVLLKVSNDSMDSFLKENPTKMVSVMETLGRRIRETSKNYSEACNLVEDYVEQKNKGGEVDQSVIRGMKELAALSKVRK